MTNYANGSKFEYLVRDYLKAMGMVVVRSAGSKGTIDLIAWNEDGYVRLIQCKTQKRKKSYKDDTLALLATQAPAHWHKQLWVKDKKFVTVHDLKLGQSITSELKDFKAVINKKERHDIGFVLVNDNGY